MTRLSEALERAGSMPTAGAQGGVATATAPVDGSEVAPTSVWRFDEEFDSSDTSSGPAASDGRSTAVAAFDHRFSPASADKLVVSPNAESAMVEQFRRLAALLHHAQVQSGTRTVMVASAVASEGKTLTATNLALTLSHSYQRRVLLIDADLRRPSIHEMFQLPNKSGIGNCLRRLSGGPLPVHRISPNLWVLTAGRPDSDPMSGLVSDAMRELLAEAAEQFDWVIVDTPPVALLSDANLLAAMIDAALLVVSANTTPYPLVKRAIDAIGASRILGVVLNRAERSTMVDGYAAYYGGYAQKPESPKRT